MVENKSGDIDSYNPYIHQRAAQWIEPRLNNLSPEEVIRRRVLVGIIPYKDVDWVFVDVNRLAIEKAAPGGRDTLIGENFPKYTGTYSKNNGIYMATTFAGLHYIACFDNPERVLHARGFRERTVDVGVLFPSSDCLAVQLALLNGVAGDLAADYHPFLRDARYYRFYAGAGGEVFAGIPPHDLIPVVSLLPAPK